MKILLILISFLVSRFKCSSFGIYSPTNRTTVAPHQYPFIVYLIFDDGSSSCGGTLVSRRFILTSGHCAYDKQQLFFTAYLGAYDLRNIYPSRTEAIQGDRIFFHENYRFLQRDDIALARLLYEADLNDFVKLVGFPPLKDAAKNLVGSNCVAVGWGNTIIDKYKRNDILRQEHLTIIDNSNCQKKTRFINITSKHLCTRTDMEGNCKDTGGPLLCDGHLQVGVIAVNIGSCVGPYGFYTMYTKVSDYLDWIFDTIRHNS